MIQIFQGRSIGVILMIAGTCIGAGMLGLPVLTGPAGFLPTEVMFFLAWLFMASTGLLLLEVNLWYDEEVSIISMAEDTLGLKGRIATWFLYLFLFYALMVAFLSGGGSLLAGFAEDIWGIEPSDWMTSALFAAVCGGLVYLGTAAVDGFNRLLMAGLILSYLFLVEAGYSHVNAELLRHQNWSAAIFALPVMVIAFGYHNLIPSMTTYLRHRPRRLALCVLIGSVIPFFVYFLWEILILGIIPFAGDGLALGGGEELVTRALRSIEGSSWISVAMECFSFFAIITSFLGVALSFVDFLADGFHVQGFSLGRGTLCGMAILPPFLFSLSYPHIFTTALGYAGAFGAVILFGLLPACMAWVGRYRNYRQGPRFLPGGRGSLVLVVLFSLFVIAIQLVKMVG